MALKSRDFCIGDIRSLSTQNAVALKVSENGNYLTISIRLTIDLPSDSSL